MTKYLYSRFGILFENQIKSIRDQYVPQSVTEFIYEHMVGLLKKYFELNFLNNLLNSLIRFLN